MDLCLIYLWGNKSLAYIFCTNFIVWNAVSNFISERCLFLFLALYVVWSECWGDKGEANILHPSLH